jgi:hypothetical protein
MNSEDKNYDEIPDILRRLLDDLEELDKLFEDLNEESDFKKFEETYRKVIDRIGGSSYRHDANVIPGWGAGECKSILLVLQNPFLYRELLHLLYYDLNIINKKNIRPKQSVATGGNFQELLLRVAAEHMKSCQGIVKYVVFYTPYWDSEIWLAYKSYFKGVQVILKIILGKYTYLKA